MIIFLNRIPIPTLKHYCLFSLSLFLIVFIYAQKVLHDISNDKFLNEKFDSNFLEENGLLVTALQTITHEPWCIWSLINFCYCGLILFSKLLQIIIFGKLRAIENQHIKDHFWNFIFLKFIFIFGVLNLENVYDIIMWTTWFSLIGFLSIHCQICKDRFEYLLFSPNTPRRSHIKLISFLVFIQLSGIALIAASLIVYKDVGLSISLFMLAESLALSLRTLYVIIKYSVHLMDLYNSSQINNKGTVNYYIDLSFEIAVVTIEFLHYFHMLIYGNFYLSMASLVICMELKRLFFDLKRRIKRHTNYLRVIEKMEKRFPWANQDELNLSEKCAVCWEILDQGRRLPCSHIFHQHCLRSWLEQHTSCPTCRKSLQEDKDLPNQQSTAANNAAATAATTTTATVTTMTAAAANNTNNQDPNLNGAQQAPNQPRFQPIQRNYFHFNGSRYFSWLPNFSIQVTNGGQFIPNLLGAARGNLEPERLNQMTEQVRQLFPNISTEIIQRDLQQTHSVEITIENILEDRLNENFNLRANNFFNDIDESDADDDDDDNSSSDDDTAGAQNLNSNNRTNTNRNNHFLNNLLDGFNNASTSSNVNTTATTTTTATTSNNDNINRTNNSSSSENRSNLANTDDDSVIISKYSTSENLSKNANDLILRKRELVLQSKKRFLEKFNQNQTSSEEKTNNEISQSQATKSEDMQSKSSDLTLKSSQEEENDPNQNLRLRTVNNNNNNNNEDTVAASN